MESKRDKLDRLSRVLQEERGELQAKIRDLTKSVGNNNPPTPSTTLPENGATTSAEPEVESVKIDPIPSEMKDESANLYGGFSFFTSFSSILLLLFQTVKLDVWPKRWIKQSLELSSIDSKRNINADPRLNNVVLFSLAGFFSTSVNSVFFWHFFSRIIIEL